MEAMIDLFDIVVKEKAIEDSCGIKDVDDVISKIEV